MNVLFVQQQPCIRALKYGKGLKAFMPEINLCFAYVGKTLSEVYGHGDELFENWFHIENEVESKLISIIEKYNINLIHCHNAPDSLTNICIKLFKNKIPIVHDIHDLMSARDTFYEDGVEDGETERDILEEERIAVEQSDAVITVAGEIFNQIKSHGFKLIDNHLIYHNYIPKSFIPKTNTNKKIDLENKLKIVYQGFISSDPDSHYYFNDIFKNLAGQGFEIHIYPSRNNQDYRILAEENKNVIYHDHLRPDELYKELVNYDFGWTGFNASVNLRHLDTVMPNKLFEFISCGLPILSLPHKSLKRFIESNKVGAVVDDVSSCMEIVQKTNWNNILIQVNKNKYAYSVEANISKVIDVYKVAIKNTANEAIKNDEKLAY